MKLATLRRWLIAAAEQDPHGLEGILASLTRAEIWALLRCWPIWAHPGQVAPDGDWRVWLMMAGRGFGKTRAGAEWVLERARLVPDARIALVSGSIEEALAVMVNGQSGVASIAAASERPVWRPSLGELRWPNGARGFLYSGVNPDKLRGPEHHFAWCDELAKWPKAQDSWDNLLMTLRLGDTPRAVVTTTPRPNPALAKIIDSRGTRLTVGRTFDNPHLPPTFRAAMMELYAGTRLGRQELDGVLFSEAEGSLWPRALLEACRLIGPLPPMDRVVIGVDPPASPTGDACGIVACGLSGEVAYVLADHSGGGLSPSQWAAKVAAAADMWNADRVIAEVNQGGKMVEDVLRGASVTLPVKPVYASKGKVARAEPVAARFERGAVKLAGFFPDLEDELSGLVPGGAYQGPGRSPDRADAMVYALTELLLGRQGIPGIRRL